jgi:serine protease Do
MDNDKIIYESQDDQPNFVLLNKDEEKYEEELSEKWEEHDPAPTKETKKKKGYFKKFIALVLIVAVSGTAGFLGGTFAVQNGMGSNAHTVEKNEITITPADHLNTAEAVAAKVIPSVVGISTTTEVIRQNIFGMRQGQLVQGVGTGFIVHEDGYIVTNSHVVDDGSAKTITVQLTDGRELTGNVLWSDATLDLAMVKIDAKNLVAAELGDSDSVNIGAYAVAIGNPLGLIFDRSVTQGVISGLNRTITVGNESKTVTMEGLIQTDASINSGNSGGPLLNSEGQVIGINSAKAASGEGLGFAIPINTAKPIIEEIMKTGTFKKAYIGVSIEDVALYLQYYPNDDLGTKTGALVTRIYEASPASLAGIKEMDVITSIEQHKIKNKDQLTKYLFSYKPGEVVRIQLYRDKKQMEVKVTLGVSPD